MAQFFAESPISNGLSTSATAFALRAYLETFLYYVGYDPSTGTSPHTFISLNDYKLGKELGLAPEKARKLYVEIWEATTPTMETVCHGIINMEDKLGCSEEVCRAVRFLFKRNHGMTPEDMIGGGGEKVVDQYSLSILESKVLPGLIKGRKGLGGGGIGGGGGWKKLIAKAGWKFGKNSKEDLDAEAAGSGSGPMREQESGIREHSPPPDEPLPLSPEEVYDSPNPRPHHHREHHHTRHSEPPPDLTPGYIELKAENIAQLEKETARRSKSMRQQERARPLRDVLGYEGPLKQEAIDGDYAQQLQQRQSQKAHHYRRRSDTGIEPKLPQSSSQRQKRHRQRAFEGGEGPYSESRGPEGEDEDTAMNGHSRHVNGLAVDPESLLQPPRSSRDGRSAGQLQNHATVSSQRPQSSIRPEPAFNDPFIDPSVPSSKSGAGERPISSRAKEKRDKKEKSGEKKRNRHKEKSRDRPATSSGGGGIPGQFPDDRDRDRDGEDYELSPPPAFEDGPGTVESTPTKKHSHGRGKDRKKKKDKDKERDRDGEVTSSSRKDREKEGDGGGGKKKKGRKDKDRDRDRDREKLMERERMEVEAQGGIVV